MRTLTEEIPEYLRPYIARQDPKLYTAMDHAGWRFIMKISRQFLAEHAQSMYLAGLEKTGISLERIPLIEDMDLKLRAMNWRAVPVSGFIPPSVFMEFLSLGVLPIACDMRRLENLAYTPAPDIVHEAAGHAPFIADPEYAEYLREYGELSRRAISSAQDRAVYLAIRSLSIVEENPVSTDAEIKEAEQKFQSALNSVDHVSEAAELARLGWWTIEYGLIGTGDNPQIYGAALLSSPGESRHSLGPDVRKIPLTLDCVKMSYDITRLQPQLYVAPNIEALKTLLRQLEKNMAFRHGGVEGLRKAVKAAAVTTTVLDSGLQITGILSGILELPVESGPPSPDTGLILRYAGPCQFAIHDKELPGHGAKYHSGIMAVLGRLRSGKSATDLTAEELALSNKPLEFESGLTLQGNPEIMIRNDGKTQLITFSHCRIRYGDRELLSPEQGAFHLTCGESVTSVFGGPADRARYYGDTGGFDQPPGIPKTNLTDDNRNLNDLYAKVRFIRDSRREDAAALLEIHDQLEQSYPDDWLLRYELLELDHAWRLTSPWTPSTTKTIHERLRAISTQSAEKAELIRRGLEVLG